MPVPNFKLNDDNEIPQLGFGTFQVDPKNTQATVEKALEVGYRHLDTAEMYQNEREVGLAVAQSGLKRGEVFITSKLNNGFHAPDDARKAFADTLEKLGSDYIDLFLIHWPMPEAYGGDFGATWRAFEEFQADGRAKSIGVSNFQVPHLEKLLDGGSIVPAVNQVELHPYFQNREVVNYCHTRNIAIEAWSPIARGQVLDDPAITTIAESSGKTLAQVVLRWHIQKGHIIFPKSVTPARIEENFNIFDFELANEQMKAIDALDKGESGRIGPNPDKLNFA
jgi:2,5-diketo-D-gluconate reductase A